MSARRYRDAGDVFREDEARLKEASRAMLDALGISGETYAEQAEVLAASLVMFAERNGEVHDAWKSVGALGNLLTLYGKILRLMNSLWWNSSEGRSEKPVDSAVDAISYSTFFIRQDRTNDLNGGPR